MTPLLSNPLNYLYNLIIEGLKMEWTNKEFTSEDLNKYFETFINSICNLENAVDELID